MKLWLISQDVNDNWDTYDSAVVAAPDEDSARRVEIGSFGKYGPWAPPEAVAAKYVGEAADDICAGEIICASFNAG